MTNPAEPSRPRILKATLIAMATAVVILLVAILPAEYGIDPLGTGRALGLLALSGATDAQQASAEPAAPDNAAAQVEFSEDEYKVELRPFEGVEYKYRLERDAALIYSWKASALVEFEFHGEPDGAPAKYFDSYAKGNGAQAHGSFTAAKPGIHGWFWKNNGPTRVTVTLRTAGFYAKSTEFRDGEKIERRFPAGGR